MDYSLAVIVGSLVGLMLDMIVLIPALLIGLLASTWRGRAIAGAVLLVVVLLIKIPTIQRIAEEFGEPAPSIPLFVLGYAAAIAVIVGIAGGGRYLWRQLALE